MCGGVFDRDYVIEENICDFNPTKDDYKCWNFYCRNCYTNPKKYEKEKKQKKTG